MKKIVLFLVVALVGVAITVAVLTDRDETPAAERIGANQQVDYDSSKILNKSFSNLDSFTAKTLDGSTFSTENFRSFDLTVVNIWGTFCGPCREEMPELALFASSLPSRIQFITICTDASGNTGDAKKILSDAGFKGITLVDGDEQFVRLLNKIQYVPTTLFFDSKGNCVGEEIIGSPRDFSGEYTRIINSILSSVGRETI